MKELKCCPFCGNDEIELVMLYHPRCKRCGCTQENIRGRDAIAEWNRRIYKEEPTMEEIENKRFIFPCDGD